MLSTSAFLSTGKAKTYTFSTQDIISVFLLDSVPTANERKALNILDNVSSELDALPLFSP